MATILRTRFLIRVALLTALWLSSVAVRQAIAAVELKFADSNFSDGRVRFRPGSCAPQLAPSAQDLQQMAREETPTYLVFVDLSNTLFVGKGQYFLYQFYIQPKHFNPAAEICSFRVEATPSGTFVDKMGDVNFSVGMGAQFEDGSIRIPLHNTSFSTPILQSQPPASAAPVSLSGQTTVPVGLANLLPDLPVEITRITPVQDGSDYWQGLPQTHLLLAASRMSTLQPGEKLDNGIELVLLTNRWRALGASIFPIAHDKPHATIHLNLEYTTPGGLAGMLPISVPLRFKPSFWSLLLAVMIGSVIGSVLAQLLPQRSQVSVWYKALPIAFFAGALAEALGMVLVIGNSQFRLLGFELDPYQLLPASLIGALVGVVGFRNSADFLKLFKKQP